MMHDFPGERYVLNRTVVDSDYDMTWGWGWGVGWGVVRNTKGR